MLSEKEGFKRQRVVRLLTISPAKLKQIIEMIFKYSFDYYQF